MKETYCRMEAVDNPFKESANSDMIVKVKDVNIFINKNILQKSKAVNKEESIIIEIINGKEWLIKRMDNYSAENVIRFFKFIICLLYTSPSPRDS